MRTRTTLYYFAFAVPAILLIFLPLSVVSYDESPWQPVVYDYYQIDLSQLGGDPGENLHSRFDYHHGGTSHVRGHKVKTQSDRDVIVDVVNSFGVKLLAIHNEHNENNIALSPYGAFSVLAALLEGLQGEAIHEILHSTHIPKDKQVVRVGLRDIHRHLKSYFIPEEGFLAGLTLNLNNVTLRTEYEDVLHFYGFDYGSFNNALYPEPPTTKQSIETTTLETGLSISEDSTVGPRNQTTIICTTMTSTYATEPSKIDESTTQITIQAKVEETTTSTTTLLETLSTIEQPETTTSTSLKSTTPSSTTLNLELTTTTEINKELSTTPESKTTAKELLDTIETSRITTTPKEESSTTILTDSPIITAKSETVNTITSAPTPKETSTLQVRTSTLPPETVVSTVTSAPKTEEMSTLPVGTSTLLPETVSTVTPAVTTEEMSTLPVRTSTFSSEAVTSSITTTQAAKTTLPTSTTPEDIVTTTQITRSSTTLEDTSNTTVIQETTVVTPIDEEIVSQVVNGSDIQSTALGVDNTAMPQGFIDDNQQDVATTTANAFFGTTPEFQDMTPANPNFDFQNYQYDNTNQPIYDDLNMVDQSNPPEGATLNDNFKRHARSVVDYVIARFYDDHPHYQPRQPPHYEADDQVTFAVYGKYRETGVNFMKYDTVLPYFYVKNLNAWALSFPLDSSKYYLLLLLPIRDDGVDKLICDLRLHGDLRYIIENLRLTHVEATIPSFTLKGYVTLTPALQILGIRKIFEPRQADFSPMTNVTDIYVTNIEQAVTVTIRNYLDPSAQNYKNFQQYPPVPFKADHPFLYFVMDSELNVALMVGKVVNPLNSRIR
ncbi:uncharacterized protein LOC126745168 [Anthonomus grandis grandis]|uniref:uncharacterized protein LOC126745168 n=1 Tax=Anthonomus grandis grandis TaxID=2921223 RepID=UPI0021650F85|nr:uncharacterized protein LOC126745168 [Anthonomus grandis grandis]